MAMFTIEDIVGSAFSDASFGLEAMELLEMVHVVTLQVNSLLAQYHAESYDDPAIPAQLATMLQRAVGDIGTSLSSLQDRSHDVFHQLLMGEPKVSSTYVRSLNELAQTLTGMIGINKLTILARIRLMMGSVKTGTHSVGFLESLGFSEPVADSKTLHGCLHLLIPRDHVLILHEDSSSNRCQKLAGRPRCRGT